MWALSIFAAPFLVYGLWTGRAWVGGRGASRTYIRETEPRWYWGAIALYCFFIIIGVVGTLCPSIDDDVIDGMIAVVVLATITILSIIVYSTYRQRDDS